MNREVMKKQIFQSDKRFILVRMARRCGKTEMLLDYLIRFLYENINKHVLVLTPSKIGCRLLVDRLQQRASGLILRTYHSIGRSVDLNNGCRVDFLPLSNEVNEAMIRGTMCGARVDLLLIDDAGSVPFSQAIHECTFEDITRIKTVMFSTVLGAGSYIARVRDMRPSSADYYVYDYKDALQDHIFTPQQVFEFKEMYAEDMFKKELGPFEPLVKVDNEMFMYKLRDLQELTEVTIPNLDWGTTGTQHLLFHK